MTCIGFFNGVRNGLRCGEGAISFRARVEVARLFVFVSGDGVLRLAVFAGNVQLHIDNTKHYYLSLNCSQLIKIALAVAYSKMSLCTVK
jgi:hypothetical protein